MPLFALGVALLLIWGILFFPQIVSNAESILADPIPVIAGVLTIPLVSFILVKYYTRGGKTAIV